MKQARAQFWFVYCLKPYISVLRGISVSFINWIQQEASIHLKIKKIQRSN